MDTPQMAQQAATAAASVPEPAAPSVGDAAAMDTPQMAQQAAAVAAGAPQPTQPGTGDANVAQAMANKPAAQPGQPVNRDSMPFGKAFADARAKGEKVFTWKGKQYAVKMASAGQAPMPNTANKSAEVSKRTGVALNSTAGGGRGGVGGPTADQLAQAAPATAAGQNVVPGKTGPNGEPIQTSQGREGYFDAKTNKWTFVKEGRVSIPEDDRILNMIRGVKF
jgi:hypothetical protein